MNVFCPECCSRTLLSPEKWRCSCGAAWEPLELAQFDPDLVGQSDPSLWRYHRLYELDFAEPVVRMGTGNTPLLAANLAGREVLLKLEYFAPTASFKDRGTEVMINVLAHQHVTRVADDSSGNAGASVAAFAARAGMKAEIYVPAYASPAKQAQIAVYGAEVKPIPGPRANAKTAALESIKRGVVLASHAYHPGFLLGQQSLAWELWEQLGRKAPDWYVVPVGQGVHLLGVWLGFKRLHTAGLVQRVPRMIGVQAQALAPLVEALAAGLDTVPGVTPTRPSLAEGLAIACPVRGRRLLQAVRDSGGTCLSVSEEAIQAAHRELAHRGLYVEPTSATVVAALPAVVELAQPGDVIVVPLTGSGLKGSPKLD